MNRGVALALLAAVMAALCLRCPSLDRRPMHNDEAVNAINFRSLWEQGTYHYDPHEYHGPTLHYATRLLSWISGAPDFLHFTETRFRMGTVLAGVGLIVLLVLVRDGLGNFSTAWAALLLAISPAFVFYSRYFIHEIFLVLFWLLTLGAVWRWHQKPKWRWAVLAGLGVGLMHATKETFVFNLAAMVLAAAFVWGWERWIDARERVQLRPGQSRFALMALAALAAWALVVIVLFSAFFTDAAGPLNSFRTYEAWMERAGGASPHIQPWSFYLQRLLYFHPANGPAWTEAFIAILAVIGGGVAYWANGWTEGNRRFVRYVAAYTFASFAAYQIVPYKTPWCLLNFWVGAILLAGVGANALWRWSPKPAVRAFVGAALALGIVQLVWQSWQTSYRYAADARNPYNYAQTSPDLLKLVDRVKAVAGTDARGHDLVIKVMGADGDYWPLPWYLREFKNVGWWDQIATDPYAPIMIVSASLNARLEEKGTHVMAGLTQFRPGVFLELYVDLGVWTQYLKATENTRRQEESE